MEETKIYPQSCLKPHKILEYLRECEIFYLATEDGARPRVRPMQSACVYEGALYFPARKDNGLYGELLRNGHVAISTTHPDKSSLLLTGLLEEDRSEEARAAMKEACIVDIEDPAVFSEEVGIFRLTQGEVALTTLSGAVEEEDI